MLQFLPGAEASCSTQPHNYIIYYLNWSPFIMWPDFFLCPFHFRTCLGVWAFPSMPLLALCLMAPEGVTRRLNMGSRDTYTCQIKKNKGFVAWHLWDSWPGGWCLGRLFVVQVSVAAVKPRITKRRNGDYGAQRERHRLCLLHTLANLPVRTWSGQRWALWCRQRGHLGYFLSQNNMIMVTYR